MDQDLEGAFPILGVQFEVFEIYYLNWILESSPTCFVKPRKTLDLVENPMEACHSQTAKVSDVNVLRAEAFLSLLGKAMILPPLLENTVEVPLLVQLP